MPSRLPRPPALDSAGLLLALFALIVSWPAGVLPAQDLVLRGGTVHTGTPTPWDGPLVVSDGRIRPAGTPVPDGVQTLDLRGAHVYPGLVDAHGHLVGLGAMLEDVDLVGTTSFDEVIDRVRARAAEREPGEWVIGRGWDQNDWEVAAFPHHAALSAAVPDHPVVLTRIDGHACLANRKAMELAGLTPETPVPEGGEIHKDAEGGLTGVFIDRATALVEGVVPAPDGNTLERRLLAAQEQCLAAGLTGVHDAGMGPRVVEIVRRLHTEGRWRLRLYVMLPIQATDTIRRGPWQTPDGLLVVRAVKGYADGALGSRGAVLLEPYADKPNSRGLLLATQPRLREWAQLCADHGFQLCVHAIGDRANREVLDAIEATNFPRGSRAARFRLEHAQIVQAADAERCRILGVIPSMQPTHLTSDMPWATERLGPARVRDAYNWTRFHELGLPVAFGSDFPVESVDPRRGLYAAVTTRESPGDRAPEGGWRPDQRLAPAVALRGFTLDAAYAAFAEHELGTIEGGKRADFTVLDRDILTGDPEGILESRTVLTVVGGVVAYRG